jgi:hypothetical protein
VLEFLCAAKEKKRSFRVFVAEGAPRYQGHLLAKELVARGLQTTVITDSAEFRFSLAGRFLLLHLLIAPPPSHIHWFRIFSSFSLISVKEDARRSINGGGIC